VVRILPVAMVIIKKNVTERAAIMDQNAQVAYVVMILMANVLLMQIDAPCLIGPTVLKIVNVALEIVTTPSAKL